MSPKAGFILQDQVVPRLKSAIPKINCVGADDPQELVQDSIALAAKLMHNLEKAKKKVSPGNIAYYTIQHVKSGRRSVGYSAADVMGSATQLRGRSRLESLEQVVCADEETGGEIFELHDVLSTNQEDPSTQAARRLDWAEFIAALPEREKLLIQFVVEGKTLRQAGQSLGLKDSTMQTSKRSLALKILEFMGAEILKEIQRKPKWSEDLLAIREKLACRHERH